MYRSRHLSLPVLLSLSGVVCPQSVPPSVASPKPCEIWGQIVGSSRLLQEGLEIELIEKGAQSSRVSRQKVYALPGGNFDLRAVPAGEYEFRVTDKSGSVVLDQLKSLEGSRDFVFLVAHDPVWTLEASNTVAVSSFQHKAPRKALSVYRASQKARASGDTANSTRLLEQTLAIDPNFAEAHNDLAATYAESGRLDDALQQAKIAVDLNPRFVEAGCNLALMLLSLNRYPEAETASRKMLEGVHDGALMHAVLALSIMSQKKDLNEAMNHLSRAIIEFPFFRLLAARALIQTGRGDLALAQVKAYLQSSAHDCERADLEAWVASTEALLTSAK